MAVAMVTIVVVVIVDVVVAVTSHSVLQLLLLYDCSSDSRMNIWQTTVVVGWAVATMSWVNPWWTKGDGQQT